MKKTVLKVAIIMVAISILFTGFVNAATDHSLKTAVVADNTTIKPGEKVTVTVSVSDINMGENGINALEGTIKYNKDVFEEVTSSDVVSLSNWATTYNAEKTNSLNGKFLSVNLSTGIKEDMDILKVTFTAKKEITETMEEEIVFEDLTSNDGVDLVNTGSKTVKVKIEVPVVEPEPTPEPTPTPKPEPTPVPTPTPTPDPGKEEPKPSKIPQTGETAVIATSIGGVTLLGGFALIKLIKNRDI